jgi:hypothetical protein
MSVEMNKKKNPNKYLETNDTFPLMFLRISIFLFLPKIFVQIQKQLATEYEIVHKYELHDLFRFLISLPMLKYPFRITIHNFHFLNILFPIFPRIFNVDFHVFVTFSVKF